MANPTPILIGTRGSKLALWQANWVKARLEAAGRVVELRIIRTTGDRLSEASLTSPVEKGVFIKEIEEALAAKFVDVAVHSMKDLPTSQPPGLCVAAVTEREDARDALVSRAGERFEDLPVGARMATSSPRRQAQLRFLRPDLVMTAVRGNLDTRLRKLERGAADALVLAAAGLNRLGLSQRVTQILSVEQMCPAAGQGALAIEIREGDERAARAVAGLDHPPTHSAVRAERVLLQALGGGCQAPIAAYAEPVPEGMLWVQGVAATPDGSRLVRAQLRGFMNEAEALGNRVAASLLEQGAAEFLQRA